MNLGDLLAITNEGTNVYVHDEDKIISYYDGKNSIDLELNEIEVIKQWTEKDGLHIEIAM